MILFPLSFWNKDNGPLIPPFPFDELPGLLGWLDGFDDGQIQVDGANQLTVWTDKSANGMNGIPSDVPAPFLAASGLMGKSLLKLTGSGYFQTVKNPLPFGEGWQYSGPLLNIQCFRMKAPVDFDYQYFQRTDGTNDSFQAYNIGGYVYTRGGNIVAGDLTSGAYNFLSSNWPGPIVSPPGGYVDVLMISMFGVAGSRAEICWKAPAVGAVPGYFATISFDAYTQTLSSNGARNFYMGGGTDNAELFPAESIISTATPADVAGLGGFNSMRDTLIKKWFGTLRPFVLCFGDSLTGGFGVGQANAYPYLLGQLQTGKDFANVGINGRTVAGLGDDWPAYQSLKRPGIDNWVNVWICTNDIAGGANADNCLNASRFLIDQIRASGWKSRFIDCIPRNFGAPFAGNPQDPVKEAFRIDFNARIEEVGADAYVRLTDSAPYNDPNAWMSTEFYMDDQVHQNAAGNARTAALINAAE